MRRVLLIRFSSLGDIILTLPCVEALVANGDEVHYLTKSAFRSLLETSGKIKQIHVIPDHAKLSELYDRSVALKALGFDAVYDLHRNLRSRIATAVIGRCDGRVRKFRLKELALYVLRRWWSVNSLWARIDRVREILDAIGYRAAIPMVRLAQLPGLPDVGHSGDIQGLVGSRYICIGAESAWPQKEWPMDRFIEVAYRMHERGFQVVWLGLRAVPAEARFEGAWDLTAKLDLPEVGAVLAGARLLLCNDSGLMHYAESVGTPVISIFGPTAKELGFGPRLGKSRIVEVDLWCRPCSKTGRWCFRLRHRRRCLSDIRAERVMTAAMDVLNETVPAPGKDRS